MSSTTTSPSSTTAPSSIKVIVSFDENTPIEFKFLAEKFNWDNLVALIQSSSTVAPPVVLYYKTAFDGPVESLEDQEQLAQLLNSMDLPRSLRFYGNADKVTAPIFVSSTAAFTRLGALVDQNKQIIQCSPRITRWVGILASMMAVEENKTFDHEFQVLEKLIQRKARKIQRRQNTQDPAAITATESDGVISAGEDEEFKDAAGETPEVIDLDSRLEGLRLGGGRGGRGGRGGHRGRHHGFGRHGPYGASGFPFSEGESWFGRRGPHFMGASPFSDDEPWFGRHGHHHRHGKSGRGGKFGRCGGEPSSDSEGEAFFGRRGGRHHHHHGRPHPFGGPHSFGGPHPFGGPLDSDEEFPGRHHHHHHRGPGFGPRGPPPAFDSEDEGFCRHGGFGGRGFGHRGGPFPPPSSFGPAGFFGHHGFGPRHHHHPWGKFDRFNFSDNEDGKKFGCNPFYNYTESETEQPKDHSRKEEPGCFRHA